MNGAGLLGAPPSLVYADHARELGHAPDVGRDFIDVLQRSGLRGRGGGAFPTATKWAAVAAGKGRRRAVLANGAEAEPASTKDRLLMTTRPHLVIDGAVIAARSVGADDIVFYVGAAHAAAVGAMQAALADRPESERARMSLIAAPPGYVAGEETAAVHYINDGVALPLAVPPRPYERGVHGHPTLVNNVETLAHVALIARFGDAWFRGCARNGSAGTILLTLAGDIQHPGVVEVPQGTTAADAMRAGGGIASGCEALLIGGYFGTWHTAARAANTPLDAGTLKRSGDTLGCGLVHALPARSCGVEASSLVLAYLARESAQQCGPCMFGLRAIAGAIQRVATFQGGDADLDHLRRWAGLIRGRGACRHPDGAANLLRSALTVFADDFAAHARASQCIAGAALALAG